MTRKTPSARADNESPSDEGVREPLGRSGGRSVSDSELLATVLGCGRPKGLAHSVAEQLLSRHGGLLGLIGRDEGTLARVGLGPRQAASVAALLELVTRFARGQVPEREPLECPATVARYLFLRYTVPDQEVLGALFLDTRNRLLGEQEVFRGALARAVAEPRQLLREGLLRGAAGLIVFHTHPSGDPTPSAEDLSFTRRLSEAGEAVGIRLVDHVILGALGRWTSLRERGGW